MRYSDIPTLKEWRAETKWIAPNHANGANGLAGQNLRMFNIEKLVAQYHAVMPMAKYDTLLDLKTEVSEWLSSIATVTKAKDFQAQVTQKAAVTVLEEVVDRRLKTYPPRKYDEVVLAGYVIKTSEGKDDPFAQGQFTADGYIGLADPASDMETRCQQMVSAIQKAVLQYQSTFLANPKKVARLPKV